MSHFHSVLKHSISARWLAKGPPFLWPVLYRRMGRHLRWMKETGCMDLLVQIHCWGGITAV